MPIRTIARSCIALFILSTAFPVAAGILNVARPPRWLGAADVAVAVILFLTVATLTVRAQALVEDRHRLAALRATQSVIALIPLLLGMYFMAGTRVNWTVIVIGLAWRGWLLLFSLPYIAAGLMSEPSTEADDPHPRTLQ